MKQYEILKEYSCVFVDLPKNRIFGTGTSLDTADLKLTLHRLTGVAVHSIQYFA